MSSDNTKKHADVAIKAGAWYVISSVIVKAIVFLSTPIFTRILTSEEYGTISTFNSWYSLLLPICTLNLTYSIGRAKIDYTDKLDEYVGAMQLLAAFVTGIFSCLVIFFFRPIVAFVELSPLAVILLLIYLLFSPAISFTQNSYRYRYKYKQNIAIAGYTSICTIVLSVILLYSLDGDKVTIRILGIVIPTVILSFAFWIKSFVKHHIKVNREFWKYGIGISAPLVVHTISLNILSQSDRIFISRICGLSDTGIYSVVYTYGLLLSVVTNAIADGWLPWFHDNFHEKRFENICKNAKMIVILGCYIGLACIGVAPEAIAILGGTTYIEGVMCVPPIVLGIVCQYIYTHYVNIELHLKKTKYVAMGTFIAAILNIILNAIFIPIYGYIAAAYTTFFSYLVLMVMHYLITKRVFKITIYNNYLMFGAIIITSFIALILTETYNYREVRWGLILLGFVSFIYVFRKYILSYILKIFRKYDVRKNRGV